MTIAHFAPREMMAIALARDLNDGEWMASGANTAITFAACMLAQKTHAPNIRVNLGANCFWCNVSDRPAEIHSLSSDYRNVRYAEARFDHPEIFYYLRRLDKFFVSGLQADAFGNVNLLGIGDDPHRLRVRGPGSVGIADTSAVVKHHYVFMTHHDRKRLVERVDWISYPGFIDGPGYREELGLRGYGPKWLVTPKAIFSFDEETKRAELFRLFPGIPEEDIRDDTGFEFATRADVTELDPPSDLEIGIVRQLDRQRLLQDN